MRDAVDMRIAVDFDGEFVAIVSGVKAGALIAASGGAFLMDGDAVRVSDPQVESKEIAAKGAKG